MLAILRQPYAVLESPRAQVRTAAIIGSFVALFLLIFQPFELNTWQTERKWVKIAGFGLITFLITSVNFILWPALFPRFFAERQWTVGRHIAFLLINILSIAVGNFLYLGYLLNLPFRGEYLLWMVSSTLAVGVFPVAGTIFYGYIQRLRQYERGAASLPISANASHESSVERSIDAVDFKPRKPITLIAENEKDTLTLSPTSLLCVESSDNYCTIYFVQDGKLQKPLLRSSLSRVESQLADHSRLVRCHRSFIVNLDRVERVTGNAQGYKLHLLHGEIEVPVARRYNETLVVELRRSPE